MLSQFRPALVMLILMTAILGAIYPAVVTGIAQVIFPSQANGSLIKQDGKAVGSALIGQPFGDAKYFWPRPSATSPYPNNASCVERIESRTAQPGIDRRSRGSHQGVAGSRSRQQSAGPGRSRHGLGQRARSAYQSGRCRIPGRACRESARSRFRQSKGAGRGAHRGPATGLPRRTARQRAAPQPGARRRGGEIIQIPLGTPLVRIIPKNAEASHRGHRGHRGSRRYGPTHAHPLGYSHRINNPMIFLCDLCDLCG